VIVLGIIIAVLCFLWLCLLALLQAARERGIREASISRNMPRISHEVIRTLCAELKKVEHQGKLSQVGRDCVAELRDEQPPLFALLVEILKQSEGAGNPQGLTSGIIVYKLFKAQMEADLLDKSLNQSRH